MKATLIKENEKQIGDFNISTVTPIDNTAITQMKQDEASFHAVFSPEFIPYYLQEKSKYKFNHLQTLLYGFLRFFLTNNSQKFYFTNKQLANMMGCGEDIIKRSIQKVIKCGEFMFTYKPKANGGTFRLVQKYTPDRDNSTRPTGTLVPANNNKVNENKKKEVSPIYKGKTREEMVEITKKLVWGKK